MRVCVAVAVLLSHLLQVFCLEPIPEVAKSLNAKKFVKLLKDAGLIGMLSGTGPFTVFVPTDDVFEQLPTGLLKQIKKDKELLQSVMRYHVLSWKLYTTEFSNEQRIITLNRNMKVKINFYGETMTVDGAKVLKADQKASNGLIHVIDRWLFQLPSQNAMQYLASSQEFTKYIYPFFKVELDHLLIDGPYTIFAPVNEAFEKLPPYLLFKLIKNQDKMIDTLKYHIVKGTHYRAGLTNGTLPTLQGKAMQVSIKQGILMVNDCTVTQSDIPVVNGVIHVIDTVLLSPFEGEY